MPKATKPKRQKLSPRQQTLMERRREAAQLRAYIDVHKRVRKLSRELLRASEQAEGALLELAHAIARRADRAVVTLESLRESTHTWRQLEDELSLTQRELDDLRATLSESGAERLVAEQAAGRLQLADKQPVGV